MAKIFLKSAEECVGKEVFFQSSSPTGDLNSLISFGPVLVIQESPAKGPNWLMVRDKRGGYGDFMTPLRFWPDRFWTEVPEHVARWKDRMDL